jgi:DNA repair protein RadA/Sms
MAKKANGVEYSCSACGRREPKWLGRCPECGEWNTFRETTVQESRKAASKDAHHLPLSAVDPQDGQRVGSGLSELDRVLGGGIMKGSAILVGGEPGIGKSTLMLQALALSQAKGRALYISGEESAGQIKLRADRLGLAREGLELFCGSDLSQAMATLDAVKPSLIVADSIQTLHSEEAGQVPGTVNQMKYCAMELVDWAKERGAALFLVAHVTKDGFIAGPKALEHLVDTVLYFEQSDSDLRFLRATKNRFGSTDEIGLFIMGPEGLREVADPSELFLVRRQGPEPAGVCVAPVYEGSRIILVEIQALTVPAKSGFSRVYSDKIDAQRVSRIAAVLEKQTGLHFSDQDIYVNVAGGMRVSEVGVELALACALYSARTGSLVAGGSALCGELSLAGEVRPVSHMARRAKTCVSLGFNRVIGAKRKQEEKADAPWEGVETLKAALAAVFGLR